MWTDADAGGLPFLIQMITLPVKYPESKVPEHVAIDLSGPTSETPRSMRGNIASETITGPLVRGLKEVER